MKTKIAYWTCQAAGWGFYTVMGISMAAQQVGWRFSMIAGYILFCLYSIALTDLLRREIRRRQWLNTLTFFTFARLFGAALLLAQDMLTRFATILRYNLHRNLNHTVPLETEVEVVSDYLALESIRLEDRLRVRFAIDPEAGKIAIPPMLLQTLVENAVKHGIAALPNGGELVIRAAIDGDSLRLDVENTGSISSPKTGSTQVGLS